MITQSYGNLAADWCHEGQLVAREALQSAFPSPHEE